jgi:hypothetical protein
MGELIKNAYNKLRVNHYFYSRAFLLGLNTLFMGIILLTLVTNPNSLKPETNAAIGMLIGAIITTQSNLVNFYFSGKEKQKEDDLNKPNEPVK